MGAKKTPRKTADAGKPADPVTPGKAWRPHLVALGALWALTLAAYANSFGAGLVFDNRLVILNDARLRAVTLQNIGLILSRDYWFGNWVSDLYRPLSTLSYLFNYSVLGNGPDPAGYHWVNFALHAINIALVYVLALWILGELRVAVAAAAVWAVHPVLTESVTNIVGRADLLAACGVLAALVCHIQAGRTTGGRKVRWLVALTLATALGMFSKESAIVTLGVMLLYDLAFTAKSEWRGRMANYAAAALPCLLFLYVRSRVLANWTAAQIPFTDNPLTGADFWTARLTAIKVIGKYVGLLLWPVNLSADYSYNQIPLFRAGDWIALAGVAVCAALVVTALWAFRRNKPVFFFVTLFFVTLAPVSNVFLLIGTIMAERFLYLPALGLAGCVAIGLAALSHHKPGKSAPILLAAMCTAFAIRTHVRNQDWSAEETLMVASAAASPDSHKPHSALATFYTGSAAVAEADRTRAILDPLPDNRNNLRAYTSVGISYRKEGDRVVSSNPSAAQAWYRKSLDALLRAQSIEKVYDRMEAQQHLRRGTAQSSYAWDAAYIELGRTYLCLSEPHEALEALDKGRHLTEHPEYFFEEISNAYRMLGDSRQAAIALIGGVMINAAQTKSTPEVVNAYQTVLSGKLVELYRQTEPQSCAVRESGGMRNIDMGCPLVKEHLCAAFRLVSREYATAGAPAGCTE